MENEANTQKPMVSIILPTYNRVNVIERAVYSILNQTYENFELIIVDDGSKDDTEQIVTAIEDKRIRYIALGQNRGPAAARNEGVRQSKYNYIAFQDSDDEWKSDKLEKQMKTLQENPDVAIVYHSYQTDRGVAYPQEWIAKEQRQGQIFPYLLRGNMIGTPTILMRKECFQAVGGFREDMRCIEDHEFVLRIAHEYPIAYIDENLLNVYTSLDSVNYQMEHFITAKLYVIEKWKKEYLRYGLLEYVIDDLLNKAATCHKETEVAMALQSILNFEVEE